MEKNNTRNILIVGGLGLFLIALSKSASPSGSKAIPGKYKTRGMNLNNPGCMRHSKKKNRTKWIGETINQPDKDFVRFDTMHNGIRANLINLRNGYINLGLTRIEDIMNKYAPPKENHTSNYVTFLKQMMGNVKIDKSNVATLAFYIFQYETNHEFGKYFSISDIKQVINKERIFS